MAHKTSMLVKLIVYIYESNAQIKRNDSVKFVQRSPTSSKFNRFQFLHRLSPSRSLFLDFGTYLGNKNAFMQNRSTLHRQLSITYIADEAIFKYGSKARIKTTKINKSSRMERIGPILHECNLCA